MDGGLGTLEGPSSRTVGETRALVADGGARLPDWTEEAMIIGNSHHCQNWAGRLKRGLIMGALLLNMSGRLGPDFISNLLEIGISGVQ